MTKQRRGNYLWVSLVVALMFVSVHAKPVYADSIPDTIRVGLMYGTTATNTAVLSSETGFVLGNYTQEGWTPILPLAGYKTLAMSVENGHIVVRDSGGVLITSDLGLNGCLVSADFETGGLISVQSKKYRGGFSFKANSNGTLNVINVLSMDEYLYGVLHKEMSQSNPIEALKAQAVAARSFAVENMDRHAADGFDVCATVHCQVYDGFQAEYPSTLQAVNDTTGIVLWYQDTPVVAYYHKNSGGHTQNVVDVWSSSVPYLTGVADPYSPNYPWSATLSVDTIAQKLTQSGQDPGTIRSVQVGGRTSTGLVSKLVITGSKATVTLDKERIRSVLGTSIILSRFFTLGDPIELDNTGANTLSRFSMFNGQDKESNGSKVYVASAYGTTVLKEASGLYLSNGSKVVVPSTTSPTTEYHDEASTSSTVVFSGRGYGHGVGMSQDGAIQMAKQGFTFDEILKFYYSNVEVR